MTLQLAKNSSIKVYRPSAGLGAGDPDRRAPHCRCRWTARSPRSPSTRSRHPRRPRSRPPRATPRPRSTGSCRDHRANVTGFEVTRQPGATHAAGHGALAQRHRPDQRHQLHLRRAGPSPDGNSAAVAAPTVTPAPAPRPRRPRRRRSPRPPPGSGSVTVTWTGPTDGGSPITGYELLERHQDPDGLRQHPQGDPHRASQEHQAPHRRTRQERRGLGQPGLHGLRDHQEVARDRLDRAGRTAVEGPLTSPSMLTSPWQPTRRDIMATTSRRSLPTASQSSSAAPSSCWP